jgi:hypothetical protein
VPGRTKEIMKDLRIAGLQAGIMTCDLPNSKQELYPHDFNIEAIDITLLN